MIRLLLVDDQSLVQEGIKAVLNLEPDLEVVGTSDNGQSAIDLVETLNPDVVLMDMRMPIMNGSTATRIICERYPKVKVLALSTYDDSQYIAEAIRAGASGYLLKDMPCDELAEAIRFAYRGYSQLAPGMLHKIIPYTTESEEAVCQELALPALTRLKELTSRELEVMRFVGTGATNREIAQKLFISEGTVKAHLTRIFSCLNLKNRSQLAIYANKLVREFDRK